MAQPVFYPEELRFLRQRAALAAQCFPLRWIVELGTGCGLSTQALAEGLCEHKPAGSAKVLTIDDYRQAELFQWSAPVAVERIRQAGLDPWVEFRQADTHGDCWEAWTDPVHLIFIDAGHDYASAKADFDVWLPKLVTGGMVLCHDVMVEPDVLLRDGALEGLQDDGYLGSTIAFGQALKATAPSMMGRCMTIGWFVVG
jgi:predicted O-methyltransferase YrrM